jgi:hypothetical protein
MDQVPMKLEKRSNRKSMSFSPQIVFKMQKDGEPVWDQTVIDRLWVSTPREAMIESGPPVEKPAVSNPPAKNADEPRPR